MNWFSKKREDVPPGGAVTFSKSAISKQSKQIEAEESVWIGVKELVSRSFPPETFEELYESCEAFFSTVNQIAVDAAGSDFKIILKEGKSENEEEKKVISNLLNHANPYQSFSEVLSALILDWGKIGYGGLEVVRNASNQVCEVYCVKASTLWIHKTKEKYCQKVGLKEIWFKRFGVEETLSKDTGKEGYFDAKTSANELIWFATHYGKNPFYGIPNILPALLSALSLRAIKSYNYSFYTNYAIPAMAIVLSGNWKDGTAASLTTFIDEKIKGSDNQNKTVVLETPKAGGTVTFEKLATLEKEGAFLRLDESLEDKVLMVYSMPPYRIGINRIGKLGGTNVREATEIYKRSVVDPLQLTLENIANFQIFETGLGITSYRIKFEKLDTKDLDAETIRYDSQIEHGLLSPNEGRALLSRSKYAEGDKFYIGSNLTEVGEASLTKRDVEEMKLISKQFAD